MHLTTVKDHHPLMSVIRLEKVEQHSTYVKNHPALMYEEVLEGMNQKIPEEQVSDLRL